MRSFRGRRVLAVAAFATLSVATAICQTPAPAPAPSATEDQSGGATAQPPVTPAPAPAAPTALPTPSITGPLSMIPPATVGKIAINGIVDFLGTATSNHVAGDHTTNATLANGFVWVQKTDGVFQFFVQAGAYDINSLGYSFLPLDKNLSELFGPVPVAFVKLQAGKNTSFLVGALPTLIGAEYTFSFQNMNVTRGLLWGQENAVNRGVQVNQTMGKVTASLSWNDGFYSNRYTWLSGSLAYVNGPNALSFVAGGNYGKTAFQKIATPVQNNSSIYNVIYTYTKGSWIVQPYFQYSNVATNSNIGIDKGASTKGGAILLSYAMKHGFSLPVRFEYIASSGSDKDGAVNLLFGPGSKGTSFTVTPTYQHGGLFARSDLSYVHLNDMGPGLGFGPNGTEQGQFRAALEVGFIFGNNVTDRK